MKSMGVMMLKDPFYNQILAGLTNTLDGNVFEACVVDLLREVYPGIAPIAGGDDAGMDGAIADGEGVAYPVVSTTENDVIGNVTRNLNTYINKGLSRRKVVVATSRKLTGRRRRNIETRGKELGFTVVQIHAQEDIAQRLHRRPKWCKTLLGITGEVPALSIFPPTQREFVDIPAIGRDEDIEWLKSTAGDLVLSGQPGSGKTFIMAKLALEGEGLFVRSSDLDKIANGIREQRPRVLFIDDAHLYCELLTQLIGLRGEVGDDFRIIANCWPGEKDGVTRALGVGSVCVRQLGLLTRDQIVKVINAVGICGPNDFIREVVDQSVGKPGLAVTLCQLARKDGVADVAYGDALFRDIKVTFERLVGVHAVPILAGFAIGGGAGMELKAVAEGLGISQMKARTIVTNLAAGGVLREIGQKVLCVEPRQLRFVLVRDVFFGGAASLDVEGFVESVRSRDAMLLTLLGAMYRGAIIADDMIRGLLVQCRKDEAWRSYAWLGERESVWILKEHPEKCVEIANAALEQAPEKVIPVLLDKAVGDKRELHNSRDHPLRKIEDWVTAAKPGSEGAVRDRKKLLEETIRWIGAGGDLTVGVRSLKTAMGTSVHYSESDPGSGHKFTMYMAHLGLHEVKELSKCWTEILAVLREYEGEIEKWFGISEMVGRWAFPYVSQVSIPENTRKFMRTISRQMLCDLIELGGEHQGVLVWAKKLIQRRNFRISITLDKEFEVLYPLRERFTEGRERREKKQAVAVKRLAKVWQADSATNVSKKLARFEREVGITERGWPVWTGVLCGHLAEQVEQPQVWAGELLKYTSDGRLVWPFIGRVLSEKGRGWVAFIEKSLENEELCRYTVELLIKEEDVPESLLEKAFAKLDGLHDMIQGTCAFANMSVDRVGRLLAHDDPQIAEAAAIGEWEAEPRGGVRKGLEDKWRVAVIRHCDESYHLIDVFKHDATIAYEWILNRMGQRQGEQLYFKEEPAITAARVLDDKQKRSLLEEMRDDVMGRRLARFIVGGDITLYKHLLRVRKSNSVVLSPLKGLPNEAWVKKAKLALDGGCKPKDIARATIGDLWEWNGRESEMWKGWLDAFDALKSHQDLRIREVGAEGVEIVKPRYERALVREHNEDVYGR